MSEATEESSFFVRSTPSENRYTRPCDVHDIAEQALSVYCHLPTRFLHVSVATWQNQLPRVVWQFGREHYLHFPSPCPISRKNSLTRLSTRSPNKVPSSVPSVLVLWCRNDGLDGVVNISSAQLVCTDWTTFKTGPRLSLPVPTAYITTYATCRTDKAQPYLVPNNCWISTPTTSPRSQSSKPFKYSISHSDCSPRLR